MAGCCQRIYSIIQGLYIIFLAFLLLGIVGHNCPLVWYLMCSILISGCRKTCAQKAKSYHPKKYNPSHSFSLIWRSISLQKLSALKLFSRIFLFISCGEFWFFGLFYFVLTLVWCTVTLIQYGRVGSSLLHWKLFSISACSSWAWLSWMSEIEICLEHATHSSQRREIWEEMLCPESHSDMDT